MAKHRLGVVLLVPHPAAGEIDGLRRAVGDGALGRVPTHLTLVPPVNVRHDRLPDALARLRSAAAATRPFRLHLGPPASFLPVSPTLYLEVGGDLDALHALRERVFAEPLERTVTLPFVPHVTLADEANPSRIEAALAALDGYRTSVAVESVHLLEEDARVWTPMAEARFAAPAVVGRGGLPVELSVTSSLDPEAGAVVEAEWHRYDEATYGPVSADVPLVVTARRDGEVLGAADCKIRREQAYLARLIVVADHRDEGVGSRLLDAFEAAAREAGAREVILRTIAGGPADVFYRRRGWAEYGRLPAWRNGRDFVQLRHRLT